MDGLRDGGVTAIGASSEDAARAEAAGRLREQAFGCAQGGSPLYGSLLERAALDVVAGGPAWEVLEPFAAEPRGTALALRFMAAVHREVLRGQGGDLARRYPSVGGAAGPEDEAWGAFADVLTRRCDTLRHTVASPCQTNEVSRSAALLGGFLLVAARTALPMRLLEVGASAGLNLRWDRYRYETDAEGWGDPASPVRIRDAFDPPPPFVPEAVEIVERRGCDPYPIDPATEEGRLALMSSVWADQIERFERLRGALAVAKDVPVRMDAAGAAAWLGARLSEPSAGAATVVFHSVVFQYLGDDEQVTMERTLRSAGDRADVLAPLAWLRMEPPDWRRHEPHQVRLTMWPGGRDELLATTGPHGRPVKWLAPPG